MASYYQLDSVFPPPRNPQRHRLLSSSHGSDVGVELSPTANTFDADLRAQLGAQITPIIPAAKASRNSNPAYEKVPLGPSHQYPPAAASRSRAVSVSSVRTLGASGFVSSSAPGDYGNLPPLPPLPNSANSCGSLKTTGHLISHQQQQQQQQHYHQQNHQHPVDSFPYQPTPLSSPSHVSPSSPQHRPANNLAPLQTALTHSGSPRSLASPTSFASSVTSPYPSLSASSSVSTAYSSIAPRKNSLTNTSKAPASNSSSTRSSLSSSSNKHTTSSSFSYPTGYFSDSDTTSYYSSNSSKRIPSPETAAVMDISTTNISTRSKKGAPGKPPATLPPPVPTDMYQTMPSTPPLRVKSSNKSLKAAQNGKAVNLPPIKTELSGSRSFTSPLSPRGSSGPRVNAGGIMSPTTPLYTFTSPTKFFKNSGNQQQLFPLVNTVGNKASYYKTSEVKNKLQVLVSSPAKFDEFIEFGFPTRLAPADLALIGVTDAATSHVQLESPVDMLFDGRVSLEQITEPHDLREQHIEIERSVFSDRQLSMYHGDGDSSGLSSPMSAVPREMTLKFTLTPASMRADEAVIYGWQSTATAMDILAADDEGAASAVSVVTGAATTTAAPRVKNRSGDVTIIADSAAVSSAIPVGGLGKDSSGSMMKRVFGKLKKNKTNGSSVMITSADLD